MPAEFACWLSRFSDEPCDGQIVKCHLIPQQKLKRIWNEVYHAKRLPTQMYPELSRWPSLKHLLDDPATWVPGCGGPMGNAGHHGQLDHSRTLRVPYARLPLQTIKLATDLMILPWLEQEYGGDRWVA
jgi:hypothetical protein